MNPLLYYLLPTLCLCALAAGLGSAFVRQRRAWATETTRRAEVWQQEQCLHRQIVRAVTGGRLWLCEPDDVQALLTGERLWTLPLLDTTDVSQFRCHLREIAVRRGLAPARVDDLCSCVSEVAGNAIRWGQGGVAQVWVEDGGFAVLVTDCGKGFRLDALLGLAGEGPAQFEALGFQLLLALSDTLAFSTGADGTQLLLKIRHELSLETESDGADRKQARAA